MKPGVTLRNFMPDPSKYKLPKQKKKRSRFKQVDSKITLKQFENVLKKFKPKPSGR